MGLYNDQGQRKVTVVDGTAYTGVYAADGSYNGFLVDELNTDYVGLYHDCGAFNVKLTTDPQTTSRSPEGAFWVSQLNDLSYVIYDGKEDLTEAP